jgi:hypothetical protein
MSGFSSKKCKNTVEMTGSGNISRTGQPETAGLFSHLRRFLATGAYFARYALA